MYTGEIAAAVTAILWAFTSLFFTVASRLIGVGAVNRTRLALALVFITGVHWLTTGSVFPFETEPWRWGILAVSSVAGLAIGDGALFLAFVYIGPRLTLLVMTIVPVFSTLFAWIWFNEILVSREILGMFITIGGIGWVVTERRNPDSEENPYPPEKYGIGIVLALVGALGQTANLVVTKFALTDGYSALSATEVRILIALVMLCLLASFQGELGRSVQKLSNKKAFSFVIAGAIAGPFLGIWFSYIAIQHTRIGIASTIMATPPLILIPLSAIFFGEKTSLRGWVGTLVAFAGVGVLLWQTGEGV